MAQYLAIDWHQDQLHLVLGSVSKGRTQVKRAVVFDETQNPESGDLALLGEMLRSRIKEAGIAPAPVIACVGRDKVILKEVTYPPVAPHEEPALIRMQVHKELTESPGSVVIDYVPLESTTPGQKRALAFILPRKLFHRYEEICRTAGLRLLALTPRPFGLAACLKEVAGTTATVPAPASPNSPVAMVTLGNRWGEFCVLRGQEVIQTRSLTVGPNLAAEIRRNLVVYAAQTRQPPVEAVYLALGSPQPALVGQLQDRLEIPIHTFDPFAGAEAPELPTSSRGSFAGAVGLLHLQSQSLDTPVNFTRPKEPKPPKQELNTLQVAMVVLGASLLLVLTLFAYRHFVTRKQQELAQLQEKTRLQEMTLKRMEQEEECLKHLDNWDSVAWVDELYEVAKRAEPFVKDSFLLREIEGKYINKVEIGRRARRIRRPDEEFDAMVTLKIDAANEKDVFDLAKKFNDTEKKITQGGRDSILKFYRTKNVQAKQSTNRAPRGSRGPRTREHTVTIGVRQRAPEHYDRPLPFEEPPPPEDFPEDFPPELMDGP